MQHELDHLTDDWVSALTGQNRDKNEFINQQHRHSFEIAQCRCTFDDDQSQACRCKPHRRQSIQMCFDFLQDR